MNGSSVRLALVGPASSVAEKSEMLQRIREAIVTVTAESMEAAFCSGEDFDAAFVVSIEDARQAAECRKHILIDAPFADSSAAAEPLIAACQKAGVILALGGLPRHTPACQAIIARLTSGKLGDPGLLRVHRWRSNPERLLSSTIFGDIDLALHLFQSTPTVIYGIGRRNHAYLQIHLGFPSGGMALLDFAQRLPTGPAYDSLSLIGSRGAAYADDHHNTHLLFGGGNPAALISDCGTGGLSELREFLNCVALGVSIKINAPSILAAHRVTDAVHASIASGEALHLRGGMYEPA